MELPADVVDLVRREHLLLRGVTAVAAGFSQGFSRPAGAGGDPRQATVLFCVQGKGWWEGHGRLSVVGRGDVLILPPNTSHACGPRASQPWTVHWVRAMGELLPDYLRQLSLGPQTPVLRIGEDPHLIRLFHEIRSSLQGGSSFARILQASQAVAYLLSCLIQRREEAHPESTDTVQRAAQAIIYMSEHLSEAVRIAALARQAGLSTAHFGELFKQHTGCSPRDYLHLLRIHQSCRLLRDSHLSIKEIAARVGYRDPLHFSRQFKEFQGISPTDYRGEAGGVSP